MKISPTRQALLTLRVTAGKPDQSTRRNITLLGCAARRRGCRGGQLKAKLKQKPGSYSQIPVVIGNRRNFSHTDNIWTASTHNAVRDNRQRTLRRIHPRPTRTLSEAVDLKSLKLQDAVLSGHTQPSLGIPSLYVLNAAALSKPGAVDHLAADLKSYDAAIAVISETHFKSKHTDNIISIDGYRLHRRDRADRKGGGVATYVLLSLRSTRWTPSVTCHSALEIDWVCVEDGRMFVAAVYHPPRPTYKPEVLLCYIESSVAEISHDYPLAEIVIAGDLNQLADQDVIECTGLSQVVYQPTRGGSILDKVFVSNPDIYSAIRAVTSVVRSDHKAVVCLPYCDSAAVLKTRSQRTYRRHTPAMHAQFLGDASSFDFTNPRPTASSHPPTNTQAAFDYFYTVVQSLLEEYFPTRTITVTSRDPKYITPRIKAMLRRKSRLMRAGKVEKAGALSVQIGKKITAQSRQLLHKINTQSDAKALWAAVRQLTKGSKAETVVDGITAELLNNHYAAMSTDAEYVQPHRRSELVKDPSDTNVDQYVTEYQIFRILDKLRPTATGTDGLPAWFLRLGAPVFCQPLTRVFNLSIATFSVPMQWKQAIIRPVAKVNPPKSAADYRPISVTPILTRMMERTVVQRFLYPAFQSSPSTLTFKDQFAFRPSGSTTAAIIYLLHTVTSMLASNPYVIVISLDFSKAFDTVRQSTMLHKLDQLDIPDNVYNWFVDYFSGHSHSTMYGGIQSRHKSINASIIQGGQVSHSVVALV